MPTRISITSCITQEDGPHALSPQVWEFAYDTKLTALHKHALQLNSARSLREVTEVTLDAMEFGLGVDFAHIAVVENGWLRMVGHRGSEKPPGDLRLDGRGVTVRAANTKTAMRIRNTSREPAYVDGKGFNRKGPPTMLSELAVPVVVDGETVAVLNVESYRPDDFTADDQQLLETLASHVAAAMSRLRREELLRASDMRYRWLFEKIPHAIYQTSSDGRLLRVNSAFAELFGYDSEEELAAVDVERDLYANPDDRKGWKRALEAQGEVRDVELVLRRRNGEKIIVLDSAHTVRDGQGSIQYYEGTLTDITERKQMEDQIKRYSEHLEEMVEQKTRQLAESEVRFRELANLLPQTVYEVDQIGNFTFVNRSGIASLGYTEEEVRSGLNALQVFVEQDRDRVKENIGRTLAGEDLGVNEYTALRKEGTTFPVMVHSTPIIHEGKPVGLRGIAMDITERKRMEEELQAAKKRLEYVVSSNPAVIYAGTPTADCSEWRSNYISDRVTGMLGFEPREFIGHPEFWDGRVHPDDLGTAQEATSHLKEGRYACDYRFLHKDGRYRWIHEEAILVRGVDGKPLEVVGCWTDITELKDFEQRLTQAEHLAAVGETAAMVGHDLRNPLQGIAAATYLLRDETLTKYERNEMLQVIEHNVEYSDGIVNDLLDYARPIELSRGEAAPKEIVADALQAVHIPGGIKVENQSQEHPRISVDQARMKRAFVNLIENAVDAMPLGGTITISTKESNGFLEIAFVDTGIGLPEKILENLWRPLQTTKAKGMGLGLAIVKRIVDAHGGEILVKSMAGEGTTYTIRLPLKTRQSNARF
jgi:PAS domain S-box-containing protein